ncbi:MAG: hypothetical protein D6692_14490, partial [Planctomycetota bacterium]
MKMRTSVNIVSGILLTATAIAAQPAEQDSRRKLDLPELVRTETEPHALIGLLLEYSLYPWSIDIVRDPKAPYKVACDRIASAPAVYAPEIERRLLALLPDQILDGDALAALGRATVDRSLDAVLENAPPGAGGQGRLRTLMSLVELLGREHAEPVLRRFYDKAHALTEQIEPFYDAAERSFPGRDER